jgi:hypothetical protein
VRASEVERTKGPILERAQASRPEIGYSGNRPARRKGGPSELIQASFASVLGEHGTLCVSTTYLAASVRLRWRSGCSVGLVIGTASHDKLK